MVTCIYCPLTFVDDDDWMNHVHMDHGEWSLIMDSLLTLAEVWTISLHAEYDGDVEALRESVVDGVQGYSCDKEIIEFFDILARDSWQEE